MKSNKQKIPLTVKLADGKTVQAKIKMPKTVSAHRLQDMNDEELRRELDSLPARIVAAREYRDKLMGALKERWATAYVNDEQFVTAYARAEAAGAEVVALMERAIKAGGIWNERHGERKFI